MADRDAGGFHTKTCMNATIRMKVAKSQVGIVDVDMKMAEVRVIRTVFATFLAFS